MHQQSAVERHSISSYCHGQTQRMSTNPTTMVKHHSTSNLFHPSRVLRSKVTHGCSHQSTDEDGITPL
eukprot:9722287-Ditylum_brightwellii.AAC.1